MLACSTDDAEEPRNREREQKLRLSTQSKTTYGIPAFTYSGARNVFNTAVPLISQDT